MNAGTPTITTTTKTMNTGNVLRYDALEQEISHVAADEDPAGEDGANGLE